MQQYKKILGKVMMTPEGTYDSNKGYDPISLITDEETGKSYISRKEVPAGTQINNREYWQPVASSGIIDNGVIILNRKNSDGQVPIYDLKSAAEAVAIGDRKGGVILAFLGFNPETDTVPTWKLYQYNDVSSSNWTNIDYWLPMDYTNKYAGWFDNEKALYDNVPFPKVGMYAYVGNSVSSAIIYRCYKDRVWQPTEDKAFSGVVNLADEEDITSKQNKLKFKDKEYNPAQYNGLGRIYLRKNMIDGKNILTQEMIEANNTIYIIQYDYDLQGQTIIIPENCIFKFQGGSFNNGMIEGRNTIIKAPITKIFGLDIELAGTWNVPEAYPEWFGAKADGLTDDTLLIQKALDIFDKIYFPALSYALTQIFIKSNTKIEFSGNCHVKAARALIDTIQTEPRVLGESMICLHEANNVTIIGNHSVIDMRRGDFPSEELGESRHCFRIKDSKNVYIENICGNNSFGDGFCLAFPDGTHNNKNITLKGCIADNNRRQGLSIIDGEDVFIEDCIFSNTHGTAPSAGIDIEPNAYEGYKINNINITNCRSKNNAGAGLLIAGSLKIDNYNKNVNININGYISENDEVGVSLQNYSLHDCLGQISFNNINVSGKYFLTVGAWGGNPNLTTIFRDCTFVKSVIIDSEVPAYNNIISFELRSGFYNTYIGDIIIDGLYIGCTINEKPLCVVNYYANYSSDNDKTLKNVQIKNINVSPNAQVINDYGPVRYSVAFAKYINVSIDFIVPYTLIGLSKYCQPYANNYYLNYGNYILGNHLSLLNHIVRFIYDGSAVAKTFVIDDSTIIFDEEFKQLSSLSITDPESSYLGGRKAATGEWIEFIAREDGWHIYNISPLMSKFISKTLK